MILSTEQTVKRLGIFSFFDRQGIVDDYVLYLLSQMRPQLEKLLVICNGELTEDGRQRLEAVADIVLVRENVGFDIWGYKEGMEHFGWQEICTYDEVVLFNDTVYGPIYPFADMFSEMNRRDLDFWGMTINGGFECDVYEGEPVDGIPVHLQSYFVVIRRSMLETEFSQNYWDNLPMLETYVQAVCRHEIIFTKIFAEQGFQWDSYVDTHDLPWQVTSYPLMMMPVELVKNRKCPIVKRRLLFAEPQYLLSESMLEHGHEMMQYLQKYTSYDTDMILKNLIRTQNMADIKNCLQLNYILPSSFSKAPLIQPPKVALFLHLYFEDEIEFCRDYAASMPDYADIIITTDTKEKKALIQEAFKDIQCNHLQVDIIRNWARDVGALLIGFKKYVDNYEYICFAHDKKGTGLQIQSNGRSFAYNCFEGILKSPAYVENLIQTFEENPLLGLLAPPNPLNGDYYSIFGFEWQGNFQRCKDLANQMDLEVNMDPDKAPIAPIGSEFWFRSDALRPLFEFGFSYDTLPQQSVAGEEDLLNAIERFHPFVAQSQGYYTAWAMPDTLAAMEITDLFYYMRRINHGWNHRTQDHAMLFHSMIKQIDNPEDRVAQQEDHVRWQSSQIDVRDKDIAWLHDQIEARDKDIAGLFNELQRTYKELASLRELVDFYQVKNQILENQKGEASY